MPIDVATKPAIAANILKKKEDERRQKQLEEGLFTSSTSKANVIVPGTGAAAAAAAAAAPRKRTLKVKDKQEQDERAEYDKLMSELGMGAQSFAPIDKMEQNIKKKTRKRDIVEEYMYGVEMEGIRPEDLDIVSEKPGIANPLQPPKKPKLVRKTEKKSTVDESGGVAAAALQKKTRKKKDDA